MSDEPELDPCPFCGSELLEVAGSDGYYSVRCLDCYAEGSTKEDRSKAILIWNSVPRELDEDAARKITDALNQAGDLIESAQVAEALNKHFPEWEWKLWVEETDSEAMRKEGWRSASKGDDAWCVWEIVYRSRKSQGTQDG